MGEVLNKRVAITVFQYQWVCQSIVEIQIDCCTEKWDKEYEVQNNM